VRDEGAAYARRLREEGVPIEHRHFEGMSHGFTAWPDRIDAAQECLDLMDGVFRRALAPAATDA